MQATSDNCVLITKKRVSLMMTRDQAEKLGILKCANCGLPRNNHFNWRPYPSAHDTRCKAYKETVFLPD